MSSLGRVNLVGCVSVEISGEEGKVLQRTPVALLATVFKCLV